MNTINLINFAYDIFKEEIKVYKKDPNIEDYNNPYKQAKKQFQGCKILLLYNVVWHWLLLLFYE